MNSKLRNLLIFAIVAVGGGFVGIAMDRLNPSPDPMQGVGALIWLVSPLAANLLLRAFGGDGWSDSGFAPKFSTSGRWYGLALLIVPLVTLLCLLGGWLTSAISLQGFAEQGWNSLWIVLGTGFATAALKNIFEEFAWRGYLTPRFAALPVHPLLNALLTGWIWAGWHVPYYLYFLNRAELQQHTSLSLPVFLLLAFLVLPFHALAFGELRLLSQTVWPSWLLHNLANALSLGLISGSFIQLAPGVAGVFFSPGTEGILYSLLIGAVGIALYRRRIGG